MRKLFLSTLFAILALSFSQEVMASPDPSSDIVSSFVEELSYVTTEWEGYEIGQKVKIYNPSDILIGYLYRVYVDDIQYGYVLYSDERGIYQAQWEGTDGAEGINGKVYFVAPGIYLNKKDMKKYISEQAEVIFENQFILGAGYYRISGYYEIGSNSYYTPYAQSKSFSDFDLPDLSSNLVNKSIHYTYKYVIDKVPDYAYRAGCGPTAVSNMIAYLDNEEWNSLTTYDGPYNFSYTSSVSVFSSNLIDHFADVFEVDSSGGSDIRFMQQELDEYFQDKISHFAGLAVVDNSHASNLPMVNTVFYDEFIDMGIPMLVGLIDHPTYFSHAVTGVGYLSTPTISGIVVHDNFSSTGKEVFIPWSEVDYYVFIYKL